MRRVDFSMGADVDVLRRRLRDLIDAEIPAGWLGAFTDDPADLELAQSFCRRLAADGLLCPAWPAAYGGHDASLWEQTAVREEMWAHHEPRGAQYMGVNWVGPTLLRNGTPEQQRRHLPPIARGEVIWCQGFSEPDSGSDLASLRTAARRDGDHWRISGQKIWTSYATMAQWCFLLARTSTGERKQHGLTIFLVPMDAPGITVRPLATMLGPHHLNEVFFDDVVLADDAVLGTVGDGWSVVREVLAFERVGIARYARVERLLQAAPTVLGPHWDALGESLRGDWARMAVRTRQARLLAYKVVQAQDAGGVDPADAASYRIAVTTLDQESAEVLRDIVDAAPITDARAARFARAVEDHWKYSRAATVSSGTTETQRILLARALTADPVSGSAPAVGRGDGPDARLSVELSDDALDFGANARAAFSKAGFDDPAVLGTAARDQRARAQEGVLGDLGAWELQPRDDPDELEAAAALCQAAGWAVVDYPIAERLAGRGAAPGEGTTVDALVVIDPVNARARIGGTDLDWAAVDVAGNRYRVDAVDARPGMLTDPALAALRVSPSEGSDPTGVALGLVLGAWTLLGHLDRAIAEACGYVRDRKQFGRPIASFQGVQFALTEAEVERAGVAVLARYALWSIQVGRPEAIDDALALRLAALEAARVVFRITHQVHGAIGFCDETLISWVSRLAQPLCRAPWGAATTRSLLARRIDRVGLVGLFGHDRVR